ncbi:hypothetical protein K2V64_11005 [Mammaliicoccus sciuri]|uniref:hypothetical protein n=1 Tax=Mammaliicoccus sciuri TaxID=1296 RepID=UPI001E390438|nr:hypothetical protein [Mammaliicoccus sciuri]MCD8862339.1 hypothetical protein [Mammaliicoccus sciuri]
MNGAKALALLGTYAMTYTISWLYSVLKPRLTRFLGFTWYLSQDLHDFLALLGT